MPLIPRIRFSFRSGAGSANLTAGIFLFKKHRKTDPLRPLPLSPILLLGLLAGPGTARGQILFDWPIRAVPQPEAVLTGAGALLWNPGGLARAPSPGRNVWITHVDGPDATGVRGLAVAGNLDLPLGLRGAAGYWHLGIPDIPRTTTSPLHGAGTIEVAEDVLLLGLAGDLGLRTGVGAALRLERGSAAGETRTRVAGDLGLSATPNLPLSPHLGVAIRGMGETPSLLAGGEVGLPPWPVSASPCTWGMDSNGPGTREKRISGSPYEVRGWSNSKPGWALPAGTVGRTGRPSGCWGWIWADIPSRSCGRSWPTVSVRFISTGRRFGCRSPGLSRNEPLRWNAEKATRVVDGWHGPMEAES